MWYLNDVNLKLDKSMMRATRQKSEGMDTEKGDHGILQYEFVQGMNTAHWGKKTDPVYHRILYSLRLPAAIAQSALPKSCTAQWTCLRAAPDAPCSAWTAV
jgi:hypothetical protein